MLKNYKTLLLWILSFITVLGGVVGFIYFTNKPVGPGELDNFAQCVKDKGAVFYGAFWCSHCQSQKKMFGNSARLLPYVECSKPDGSGQLPFCTEKGIEGYPTWTFADGSKENGEVPLERLAEKTGCQLPK